MGNTKREVVNLGIQIDKDIRDQLAECAEREERTMRVIVERALRDYFKKSLEQESKGEL